MDEEFHVEAISESDQIALEGMKESYEAALLYNDSLTMCSIETFSCDSATISHFDDMFHQQDEFFEFHHGNFSHNNDGDDHHHPNGQTVWHDGMMGHDQHSDDEHHGYEHNSETLENMNHLRELHLEVHPN
jgi:hypothetical protein